MSRFPSMAFLGKPMLRFCTPGLLMWASLAGCERSQSAKDQRVELEEKKTERATAQMGDFNYVHVGWFYDMEIAGQILSKLEEDGVRAVSEVGTGTLSLWVVESMEAEGRELIRSNPDWVEAWIQHGVEDP